MTAGTEERKLAAIMFTDMVGYSALAQRQEALALALLEEHRRLLRSLFPAHHGQEVETAGDAFLVEFASALEASQCAIEIQRQLSARNQGLPAERQIHLRIGIHIGDVVHKDQKVMGDAVNIAARVETLAEPGGICVSRAVFEQVQGKLRESLISLGMAELKNMARPVEVFRIQLAKAAASASPEPNVPPEPSMPSVEAVALSRLRHELRTPINHILGYCELLLEEGQLAGPAAEDLRRIRAGGRELQTLIARHFGEENFRHARDLHQLYHELRTPVNHIIGYSDLLIEQAEEAGNASPIADLKKIREAANNWLGLMEAYLIEPALPSAPGEGPPESALPLALNLGLTLNVPRPRSANARFQDAGAILIVDDDQTSREMLARRLRRSGYTVSAVASGLQGLALARKQRFDLVLLDMIMPGLDGFQVLAKFKAEAALRDIPVIMLSALDDENGIAHSIELGAEDYLAKPFNPVFLRARIGACLESKRLRDKERATHAALERSEKHLSAELAKAAAYVRSLLPEPLSGSVESEWCFQPSEHLGGDAFGHHWIDPHHLAIYLLDVCGHGVGAALLSVSVLNALRTETLAGVDFHYPVDVLTALNRVFRMERQNNLFFSIWYGVYRIADRELVYGSGGHPPALLLSPGQSHQALVSTLRTQGPAVGCLDDVRYVSAVQPIQPGSRLLVFSDGVFEIFQGDDLAGTWEEFLRTFDSPEVQRLRPSERLTRALHLRGAGSLEDDFSLLEIRFSAARALP